MLHEILLALVGHCGSFIVERRAVVATSPELLASARAGEAATAEESRVVAFEVAREVDFVSPAERKLLDELCRLGFLYSQLEQFVESQQGVGLSAEGVAGGVGVAGGGGNSLYLRAMKSGIEEVLNSYRATVLRAEQEILRESVYPLTRLRQNLHEFDLVLETLHSMMLEVTETADVRALRGGEVLRALHQRSQTGVPDVQACMQRLLFHCHQVLFNQIGAWIVSGRLSDPLGEFFIEMVQDGADGGAGAAVAAAAAAAAAAPAAAGDELEESSVAGGAGDHVSSFRKSPRMPSAPATAAAAAAARGLASSALVHQLPWNAQYRLRQSMVPHSYLPLPLAHRILFIGQAVSLLQHPAVQRFGSQLTHNDLLSFARAVHQLKQMPVFDVVRVGLVMEEIRSVVTSHLWDLVVKKGELVAHLTALKSFFLVGHGEFFQAFIEAVHQRDMFKLEPTERAEPDVRAGPFLAAAIACGIEDWEFFRNLDIRIEPSMFFFKAFLPKHVSSYGNAKPNSIVLAGSAQHVSAAHALSLTAGGAARQVGGIWYSSRKSLDQGFETSFRFQLVHEALAPGGAAAPASPSKGPLRQQPGGGTRFDFGAARADAAPSVRSGESGSGEGSVARQQLTWLASTKGFSFVVQNAGMGALPSVTKHEWDGRDDAELANVVQAEDAAGARAEVYRYRPVPNSLEVHFHIAAPEDPAAELAPLRRRSFNWVAVHATSPDGGESKLLAMAVAQPRPDAKRREEKGDPESMEAQAALVERGLRGLFLLGDGKEHLVLIRYEAPKPVGAGGAPPPAAVAATPGAAGDRPQGALVIYIDDLRTAALSVALSLSQHVRLDSGRGWLGFTAASGFASSGREARDLTRTATARQLLLWEFKEVHSRKLSAWDNVRLEYTVKPPIDLALLTDDFDRYNAVFRFLFTVKRVQIGLQKLWAWQMSAARAGDTVLGQLTGLFALRAAMQFVVDNIFYYLQVDVVESEFADLLRRIETSKDFESVHHAHDEYLANLTRHCFLYTPAVSRALQRLFDVCLRFCGEVEARGDAVDIGAVAAIEREFHAHLAFLYDVLSGSSGNYASPRISQLVARIDFNHFVSGAAARRPRMTAP